MNAVVFNHPIEEVTSWLLNATEDVGPEYFQLPVAGQRDAIYRERVYCYELYHQWRCRWREGFAYTLGGEIDKSGHPLIRGSSKPDFLVHVPGNMGNNLLVVEVKPAMSSRGKMASDLVKLCRFRRTPIDYSFAFFLVYGLALEDWPDLRDEIVDALWPNDAIDPELFSIVVHPSAGTRAMFVPW